MSTRFPSTLVAAGSILLAALCASFVAGAWQDRADIDVDAEQASVFVQSGGAAADADTAASTSVPTFEQARAPQASRSAF